MTVAGNGRCHLHIAAKQTAQIRMKEMGDNGIGQVLCLAPSFAQRCENADRKKPALFAGQAEGIGVAVIGHQMAQNQGIAFGARFGVLEHNWRCVGQGG